MSKGIWRFVLPAFLVTCLFFPQLSHSQSQKDDGVKEFSTKSEKTGGLRLGMQEKDIEKNISCKHRKTREILEGATGLYVQTWNYPECGVVLKMSSERKGGAKTVESITIAAPSELSTTRGIHIGSTESEVVKAYGPYRDREGGTKKGKKFIAGSIYDGMIFDFKDGRVVKIFLGAAAE